VLLLSDTHSLTLTLAEQDGTTNVISSSRVSVFVALSPLLDWSEKKLRRDDAA